MRRQVHASLLANAVGLAALAGCGDGAAATESAEAKAVVETADVGSGGGLVLVAPAHAAHENWVDLGDVELGEVVERTVELRNREDAPLTVRSIQAGCSCTTPSLSYVRADGERVTATPRSAGDVLTLPAGVTAELILRVDSRRAPVRNKPKLISIRIVTDSVTDPYLTVEARLLVVTPFRTVPDAVEMGRVAQNGGGKTAIRVFTADDSGRLVTGVHSAPDGFEAVLTEADYLGAPSWSLQVLAFPPVPLGYATYEIELSTTGPDGQGEGAPYGVPLRITGVTDLEVRPTRLLLRPPTPGELPVAEVQVASHLPGERLKIVWTELEGDRSDKLVVELAPLQPDDDGRSAQWAIRLEASEELGAAALYGTLTIELDDGQQTRFVIPYLALAQP